MTRAPLGRLNQLEKTCSSIVEMNEMAYSCTCSNLMVYSVVREPEVPYGR